VFAVTRLFLQCEVHLMTIDLGSETPVSLTQHARKLLRRRRGKKSHVSRLYRCSTWSCRGVVLETMQVDGTQCTSHEASVRFFQQLSGQFEIAPQAKLCTTAAWGYAVDSAHIRGCGFVNCVDSPRPKSAALSHRGIWQRRTAKCISLTPGAAESEVHVEA
jgi:hypothetical protein